MKSATMISFCLFVAWVLLAIVDMWFDIVSWAVFIKLTITLALLLVVALAITIAKREHTGDETLKEDK